MDGWMDKTTQISNEMLLHIQSVLQLTLLSGWTHAQLSLPTSVSPADASYRELSLQASGLVLQYGGNA